MLKIIILFVILAQYECTYIRVYSSFWEPLFNPQILNYRVDAKFNPEMAIKAKEQYEKMHGRRGERLIADLGAGKGPTDSANDGTIYEDVIFYNTYPKAIN